MFSWLTKGNSTWIFGIVIIGIIIFIIYNGITKKKKEKKEQTKREDEVKKKIKEHLLETKKIKNISIKFVKVIPRIGKIYKYRDVFDVFIEIKNTKRNKVLNKIAFEVEGVATPDPEIKNDFSVQWFINKEFNNYEEHINLIEKTPNSSWKIHWRGLFIKKNKRKQWKKEQKQKISNWNKEQELRYKKIENSKKKTTEIFKPKIKKREEK